MHLFLISKWKKRHDERQMTKKIGQRGKEDRYISIYIYIYIYIYMFIFLYVYIWARKWVDFIFDLFLHIFFLDYLLFPTLAKDLSQKYHIKCLLFLVIRKKWIIEESFGMHLNKELWNYYFYIPNINFKHSSEA